MLTRTTFPKLPFATVRYGAVAGELTGRQADSAGTEKPFTREPVNASFFNRRGGFLLAERNGHSLSDDLAAEPPITVHSAGEIAAGVRQLLQENES